MIIEIEILLTTIIMSILNFILLTIIKTPLMISTSQPTISVLREIDKDY